MNRISKILIDDLLLGFVITLLILLLQWGQTDWLSRLDGMAYDVKLNKFSQVRGSGTSNIQIVDIDEQSLTQIGRWPWPRRQLAELVSNLSAQGAIVIAFDMLFSEPQQNPVTQVDASLQRHGLSYDLSAIKAELDDDLTFAEHLARNDTVLGTLFLNQQADSKGHIFAPKMIQNLPNAPITNALPKFSSYNASIDILNQAAQGQGFINAVIDQDGFIRRTALLSQFQNKLYPSLALETFRVYSLVERIEPLWLIKQNFALLTGVKIGTTIISTDNKSQLLIPYKGPVKSYPYTSASDIMLGRIHDARFQQAVVFIGTSAVGMADLRTTPVSLVYPGIEIHATVFDALMQPQAQPYRPDWWLAANLVLILILGLLLSFYLPKLPPVTMAFASALLFSLVLIANIYLWRVQYIHLPIIAPLATIVIVAMLAIAKGFYRENKQRRQVKTIFEQYVPPAHINELLNDPHASEMQGERKQLTVLFSDIRNFTNMSEGLTANQLKQLLNHYLSPITEIIFSQHGTIDKYVGDMVMAFWGAPITDQRHAHHAVSAAFAMLTCTEQLAQQFKQQGLPEIAVGIGINTGEMSVGDMGSSFRRAYTVLGDAVNLGSRLESLTKFYGVKMLVSEYTRYAAADFSYQIIDQVKVKGKSLPVRIYLPLALDSLTKALQQAQLFNQFFDCYQKQQFSQAQQLLDSFKQSSDQQHLIALYQARLDHYRQNPPAETWDGTYTHSTK
jgi:adenylate cyclase